MFVPDVDKVRQSYGGALVGEGMEVNLIVITFAGVASDLRNHRFAVSIVGFPDGPGQRDKSLPHLR